MLYVIYMISSLISLILLVLKLSNLWRNWESSKNKSPIFIFHITIIVLVSYSSFNRLDIPPYETYEKFLEKLTCAVEETCGFTVE